MAIVQRQNMAWSSATTSDPRSVDTGQDTLSGSLLVLLVSARATGLTITVSDETTGSWTPFAWSGTDHGSVGASLWGFWKITSEGSSGGGNTLQITGVSTASNALQFLEYTGAVGIGGEASTCAEFTSTTTPDGAAGTVTATANGVAVGCGMTTSSFTVASWTDANWTNIFSASIGPIASQPATASSSYEPEPVFGATESGLLAAFVVSDGTGGSVTVVPRRMTLIGTG